MEEDKKRVNEKTDNPTDVRVGDETEEKVESNTSTNSTKATKKVSSKGKMTLLVTVIVIITLGFSLVYILEKDGRIDTGVFAGVIAKAPVAKVNGVVIPRGDLDSGVQQLVEISKMQGADTESPEVLAEFRQQAIDTLINGELLRQSALDKGIEFDSEMVDSRFEEIKEGIGGEENLVAKMAEFGITEEGLRRDIENEILIQALFDQIVSQENIEVTDQEVSDYYEQLTVSNTNLPELEEVRDEIVEQIKLSKEQQIIGQYIDGLRSEADIEILLD